MIRGGKTLVLVTLFILIISTLNIALAIEEDAPTDSPSDTFTDTAPVETPQEDKTTKAATWLQNTTKDTAGVFEQSLAIIAMLTAGRTDISEHVQNLKEAKDIANCWPKGRCKIKETAVATLAMRLAGQTEEAEKGIEWLKTAKSVNPTTGEWWIVIKAPSGQGSCDISYQGRSPKTYIIENDLIKEAPGKYYINVAEINPSIVRTLTPTINVDCNEGSIIALIYKPEPDRYFIQKSEASPSIELKLANACYGETKGARCDYESTAYATLALLEIGETGSTLEDLGSVIYLQSKVKQNNPKELALLNRILYKSGSLALSFVEDLVKLQRPDGSWGIDTFTTALATFSLSGNSEKSDNVNRANLYLERKQDKIDGSWNKDVKSTAMAILALKGPDLASASVTNGGRTTPGLSTENCNDEIDNDEDGFADCGDSDCITYLQALCNNGLKDTCEEDRDCGGQCGSCEEQIGPAPEAECMVDGDCGTDQECRSGTCVTKVEAECMVDGDCGTDQECLRGSCTPKIIEEEGGFPWILTIIIILLIGGLGFFYVKYIRTGKVDLKSLFSKKPKGPSFEDYKRQAEFRQTQPAISQKPRSMQSPSSQRPQIRPIVKPTRSKEEDELERSIREAQKLVKGN